MDIYKEILKPELLNKMMDDYLGTVAEWKNCNEPDIDKRIIAREATSTYVLKYIDMLREHDVEIQKIFDSVEAGILPFFEGYLAAIRGNIEVI